MRGGGDSSGGSGWASRSSEDCCFIQYLSRHSILSRTCSVAIAYNLATATVMIGGFGTAGLPNELTDAVLAQGATGLTIVNNNAGNGDTGLAAR